MVDMASFDNIGYRFGLYDWSIKTCMCCGRQDRVRIEKCPYTVDKPEIGVKFKVDVYYGYCQHCGAEAYVPELIDLNAAILDTEYRIARNP